jgi:hypothetical protein
MEGVAYSRVTRYLQVSSRKTRVARTENTIIGIKFCGNCGEALHISANKNG